MQQRIRAHFKEVDLGSPLHTDLVVVPGVRSTWYLKYGQHAYYLYDLSKGKCFEVSISHLDIVGPGWRLLRALLPTTRCNSWLGGCLRRDFQYGFNLLEQITLMTVPHTAVMLADGVFRISLWSYFGTLEVDCNTQTVVYRLLDQNRPDQVLGSREWLEPTTGERYVMSYSLADSLQRASAPDSKVAARLLKQGAAGNQVEVIWQGKFVDNLHDIVLSRTKRYAALCELGMLQDSSGGIIPSRVLVLDLREGREWQIDRLVVAAHAQFDPEDEGIIYCSQHNFRFRHSSLWALVRSGGYRVEFLGDASIYKYEIDADGPREVGVFTEPGFRRLTNFHCFLHRGRKLIVATGFPNSLYLVDPETMRCIRKIEIRNPRSWKHAFRSPDCVVGTIAPSSDGEKVFVQTNWSFQIVDLETGRAEFVRALGRIHSCSNHMTSASFSGSEERKR